MGVSWLEGRGNGKSFFFKEGRKAKPPLSHLPSRAISMDQHQHKHSHDLNAAG